MYSSKILLVLGLLPLSVFAQTAQIAGQLTDPSGAVVPDAKISATNKDTGIRRATESNDRGIYLIPSLQPGTYVLQVEKAGFRPVRQSGIKLDVAQEARLDLVLEIGALSDAVTVEATTSLLQVADTSQGQVISQRNIVEMPLNGRNYTQLIVLSNGASTPEPATRGASSGFSSNGQRSYQNNFILDGIDNNSNLLAVQSNDFEVIQPNIDAIQEFKVQTSGYSAEYGRGSGAVVNVILRSGTNQVHGTAFEFLRNDKFEGNDFFNNRAGVTRPAFRQNQFGGTLGGPVRKDKLFLFGDYQGTRIRKASTQYSLLPTTLERTGDFSQTLVSGKLQTIYDPATYDAATNTRAVFPGNIIPASRFDTVAQKLKDLYPVPNTSATAANYLSNFPIRNDADQFDIRGDWQATTALQIFMRYSYQNQPIYNPPPLPPPAVGGAFSQGPRTNTSDSAAIGVTDVITPRLLTSLRLGYIRLVSNWPTTNSQPLNAQYGIKGVPPDLPGLASISVTGNAALGDPGFLPNITKANTYQILDTFAWTKGTHDIKFGGEVRQVQSTLFTTPQTRGAFTFSGNFTRQSSTLTGGSGFADMLLGIPTTSTISATSQAFYIRNPFALFIQDGWRALPKLTLNFGLRYERVPWYHERYGHIANLSLTGTSGIPSLLLPGSPGIPGGSMADTPNLNFAPRAGASYQVSPSMVVRAGYGIFYGSEEQIGGGPMLHNNPPFNSSSSFTTNNIVPNLTLAGGFPAGAALSNPQRPTLYQLATDFHAPYAQQWNVTAEKEFSKLLLSLAYIGSTSTHLYQSFSINSPPPGAGNIATRRPIQLASIPILGVIPIGGITHVEPRGRANYNSLQFKAEKRYSNGLSFLFSWIYSKSIDYGAEPLGDGTGAINNNLNLDAERSSSSFDIRHRIVASYGYELPFGKGRHWLGSLSGPGNVVLGGWQMQGIVTYRTGAPYSPTATGNLSNTDSGNRPNVIGDPNQLAARSIDRWFNTAAFALQAPFTFGNAGRDVIFGPSLTNTDFSLFKNFRIVENVNLQFRAEAFNLLNTANFGGPGLTLGTVGFGVIQATSAPPRELQFALKLSF